MSWFRFRIRLGFLLRAFRSLPESTDTEGGDRKAFEVLAIACAVSVVQKAQAMDLLWGYVLVDRAEYDRLRQAADQ